MTSIFVRSLASNFDAALRLMEAALADSTEALWQTDLWPDEAPTSPTPHGGLHGSAPWFLGYHALSCLDYDLTGDFEPWTPPPPFDDNTYAFPNRVFTQPELLGYVERCRSRVRETLDTLTEESAARPLPPTHRTPRHRLRGARRKRSRPCHRARRTDPAVPDHGGRQGHTHAR